MLASNGFANGILPGQAQVLIVGAGTTGLYLALALQRNGITPRIIEKLDAPSVGQRGAMPRTLEIMESLGFVDQVTQRAVTRLKIRPYLTGTMTPSAPDFDIFAAGRTETPNIPYPNPVFLGQNTHQVLVGTVFQQNDLQLERGVELLTLEQCNNYVQVKLRYVNTGIVEEARFKYVVGCDGARGTVRKHIGLTFQGESRLQKFIVGDLVLPELPSEAWHLWGSVNDVMVYLRPTDIAGMFALQAGGANFADYVEIFESDVSLKKFLVKVSGNDMFERAQITFRSEYNVNIRMTDSFLVGRVFLAGDACHLHTPAGGQGLNTGIQDAYNLGWKIALVVKGLARPTLLDSYNEERMPVVEAILQVTTRIWNIASDDLASAMRNIALKPELDQLGVNYRRSGIILDDEIDGDKYAKVVSPYGGDVSGKLYAGDRAPDATSFKPLGRGNHTTRLFRIFDPARHTVLIFPTDGDYTLTDTFEPSSELVQFVGVYKAGTFTKDFEAPNGWLAVEDTNGHAYRSYQITAFGPRTFVVRPDGYIGARVYGMKRVEEYFKNILHVQ